MCPDARLRPAASGFTLVELLVAITILAIVAVLGWRGLDGIVRARVGLTAEMEQTRGIQIAFAQLENDGAHLADSDILPGRDSLRATESRLLMIRTVFEENQPTRLQVVAYRLLDGVLSRRESVATRDLAVLDNDWQSALNDADTMVGVPLQSEVSSFSLRTWSGGESGWRVAGSDAGAGAATAAAIAGANPPGASQDPRAGQKTGLEVALQLHGREQAMIKIVLLGAV